jgi:hypothetical protein
VTDAHQPDSWPTNRLQELPMWPEMINAAINANTVMHEAAHQLLTDPDVVDAEQIVGLIFDLSESFGTTPEEVLAGSLVLFARAWETINVTYDACRQSGATHAYWARQLHALS